MKEKTYTFSRSGSSITGYTNTISYSYAMHGNDTSYRIGSYTSKINNNSALTYTYRYDGNGNITHISYSDGKHIYYTYDDIGQLIREDNQTLGNTYVYEYDNAGNILKRKTYSYTTGTLPASPNTTYSYGYSSGAWGDQLTTYRDKTLTYDDLGNPLYYHNGYGFGKNFTWTGRQLTGMTQSDTFTENTNRTLIFHHY